MINRYFPSIIFFYLILFCIWEDYYLFLNVLSHLTKFSYCSNRFFRYSLRFLMHITKLPTNTYFFLFFITFILLISFSNFISWTSLKDNVIMNIFILFLNIKKWFLVLDALDNILFYMEQ